MNETDAKAVNDILDRLKLFGGIFGPIVPEAMATLDGWNWQTNQLTERIILTRGTGPVDLLPAVRATGEREKGWGVTLGVVFSDPDSELIFTSDNWAVRATPRLLNMLGLTTPNNVNVWNNVYNPATPVGPMYGIMWTPSKFWPYKTQVIFQAQHPATAFTATSQVLFALMGRMYIRDSKQYYESIFVESQRQAIGTVKVPIRRGT